MNATDPDGDEFRWVKENGDGDIDPKTGLFSWTPTWNDLGLTNNLQVKVFTLDHAERCDTRTIPIDIAHSPPGGVQGTQNPEFLVPGNTVTVPIELTNDDNDTLSLSVVEGPGEVTIPDPENQPNNALFTWDVPQNQPSESVPVTVRITVVDDPDPNTNQFDVPFAIDVS